MRAELPCPGTSYKEYGLGKFAHSPDRQSRSVTIAGRGHHARSFCTETIPSGTVCWRRAERVYMSGCRWRGPDCWRPSGSARWRPR